MHINGIYHTFAYCYDCIKQTYENNYYAYKRYNCRRNGN